MEELQHLPLFYLTLYSTLCHYTHSTITFCDETELDACHHLQVNNGNLSHAWLKRTNVKL